VTARLNAVYTNEDSGLDKRIRRAQRRSLSQNAW